MKMIKKHSRFKKGLVVAATMTVLAVTFIIVAYSRIFAVAGNTLTDIPDIVTIDNRTYTKENPMIIMEIVPDLSLGTLGYLVGDDSNPVLAEDIQKLKGVVSDEEFNKVLSTWNTQVNNIILNTDNYGVMTDLSTDKLVEAFEDRNLFANAIYNNSSMSDKMKVVVVCPKDLTLQENEDGTTSFFDANTNQTYDPGLIYIHRDRLDSKLIYNGMADYNEKYNLGLKYEKTVSTDFEYENITDGSNNLRADVAVEIYLRAAKEKTCALITDATLVKDNPQNGDNISKLILATASARSDVFVNIFAKNKEVSEEVIYTGHYEENGLDISGKMVVGDWNWDIYYEGSTEGNISEVYGATCNYDGCNERKETEYNVKYRHIIKNPQLVWSKAMFSTTELGLSYNASGYYYHNHDTQNPIWELKVTNEWSGGPKYDLFPNASGGPVYVSGKILNINGQQGIEYILNSTADGSGNNVSADFDKIESNNGIYKYSDMVEFILGGTPTYQNIKKINVLEIDPAGETKYSSTDAAIGYAKAKEIASFFKVSFGEMNESNYKDYVNVKSIASNGFIGLQEDLASTYDLIIVTDYNTVNGIKTQNVEVYSSKGETMNLDVTYDGRETTAALSGNDFTEKALNKLMTYIDTGKPMVIASSIYNNKAETDVNVYKLSKAKLEYNGKDLSNVICEPDTESKISKGLTYKNTPSFTADDKFLCKYTDTGYIDVAGAFTKNDLKNFTFSGTITDYNKDAGKTYYLELSLDKNGNGLYTAQEDDDTGYEIVFSGAVTVNENCEFTTGKIDIPDTLKGYIRWRARISNDSDFKLASSVENAFVIKYEKKETVKVLQINPEDEVTFSMGDDAFKNKFAAISEVIGVELNVDVKKVSEFVDMYKGLSYNAEAGDYFTSNNKLKEYKMVVIGFADDFSNEDITSEAAMNNLVDFAEKGNAVLFAHDTITFSAYSDSTVQNGENKKTANGVKYEAAKNITINFRYMAGMDKYDVSVGSLKTETLQQGFSNMYLMRWAKLNDKKYPMYGGMSESSVEKVITTDTVTRLNVGQVTDYPYKIEETINVADTHAQYYQIDLESQSNTINSDGTKDYSDTDEDIVVWYTLGGNVKKQTTDDTSNEISDSVLKTNLTGWNYKNYNDSKSANYVSVSGSTTNIIEFTPAVDGKIKIQACGDTHGNIKYVISSSNNTVNESFNAGKKNTQEKEIDVKAGVTYYLRSEMGKAYVKLIQFTQLGDTEKYLKWSDDFSSNLNNPVNGCVIPTETKGIADQDDNSSSVYYSLAGQDALNNYYIYSKGNITYSGAGHSNMNGDAELELFVNTVVKALESGNTPPEVTVQDAVSTGAGTYEQYVRDGQENVTIKFTPSDVDMGIGNGAFASGLIYWDVDNNGTYDETKDIVLESYEDGELRNRTQMVYKFTEENLLQKYNDIDLKTAIRNGTASIGIIVQDKASAGQVAQAHVKLVFRDLFKLE